MSEAGARGVAAVVSGGRGFARKVVLLSSRLFFFKDRQREAAAAFSFLLPLQELFGSASSLPNTSCTRHGQDRGLESSAVSHWCSTPQSPHTVRCQQLVRGHCLLLGAIFFFGVRINKWKLLFFPRCLAAVRRCSGSPVACYILLSTSCCFAGESSLGGGVRSHSRITSFLLACMMADLKLGIY